jgi:sec-independent protein translocase protein TatA
VPEFLGSWEFIVLALLVLVLFGSKRLPDSARALGRSMRIFKAETKGLRSDSDTVVQPEAISPAPAPVPPPAPAPVNQPAEQQRGTQQ